MWKLCHIQYLGMIVTIPNDCTHEFIRAITSLWERYNGIVWEWVSNLIPHFIMEVINFASFWIPNLWATSEERPRNLLDV